MATRRQQAAEPAAAAMRPVSRADRGTWAYDPRAEVWRPLTLIETGTERDDLSPGELGDLLDAGADVPDWFTPKPWRANCGGPGRPAPSEGSCCS